MGTKYRVPVEETFSWQRPILAIANSGTATKGFRYIVGSVPAGDFAALTPNDIAWYDGTTWQHDTPSEGWYVYNKDDNKRYLFDGSAWVDDSGSGTGDMLKTTYDTDDDGIVDKAETVDDGAGNSTTAAEVKTAYDSRGQYDSDLGCIMFEL